MIETAPFAVARAPVDGWLAVWPLATALLAAGLLTVLRERTRLHLGLAMLSGAAIVTANGVLVLNVLAQGPVVMASGGWLPPLGSVMFADMTGALVACSASLAVLAVLPFARTEIAPEAMRKGFYPLVFLLLAGAQGVLATGDLLTLYVWLEVMVIAALGLRLVLGGITRNGPGLAVAGVLGSALLLLGIGASQAMTGTLGLAGLAEGFSRATPGAVVAVAGLFGLGLALKTLLFIPAFTLPAAIAALWAGVLAPVGIYAAIRLFALLPADQRVTLAPGLTVLATVAMVAGPLLALVQTDIRRALVLLVVGAGGAVLGGTALGSVRGMGGAVIHLAQLGMVFCALLLVAGLIERMNGTRDMRQMGGLYGADIYVSVMVLVLLAAGAGLPPFPGFWALLLLAEGGLREEAFGLVAPMLASALLTLVVLARIWARTVWRNGPEGARSEQPNGRLTRLSRAETGLTLGPVLVLTGIIALIGFFPDPLFSAAGIAGFDLRPPALAIDLVSPGSS